MLNPFGSNDNMGSYFGLRNRLLGKLKSSNVEKQISEILQNAYDDILKSENIVLVKVERKHLMTDLSAQILVDLAKRIKSN